MAIRLLTAGDSHGPALTGILEGIPAGLTLNEEMLLVDLQRRQRGSGSGARMQIEKDRCRILSGLYKGVTTGAPLGLSIENLDYVNWIDHEAPLYSVPRPGHADFAGALKYGFAETRPISERASARETAMRVAMGAIARRLLLAADIEIFSRVTCIGPVQSMEPAAELILDAEEMREIHHRCELSPVRCSSAAASEQMAQVIEAARKAGDTAGGTVEALAFGLPVGIGSHIQWDRRLDSRLAAMAMSIPAVKAVEIGAGAEVAQRPGSQIQDEIFPDEQGFARRSNRAGGIEGGMSNGMPVVLRVHIKPIATLHKTLRSVDLSDGRSRRARYQRSDVCVVPRGSIVVESVLALTLADALTETFGADRVDHMLENISRARTRMVGAAAHTHHGA
jgi:chorismate synthase